MENWDDSEYGSRNHQISTSGHFISPISIPHKSDIVEDMIPSIFPTKKPEGLIQIPIFQIKRFFDYKNMECKRI